MFNKIKKVIHNPWSLFYFFAMHGCFSWMQDEKYIKCLYRGRLGKQLNLNQPKTYNEKLQWLKLYDQKDFYTSLVDKYEVRKFVAQKIGEEYLVPLIGVWDSPEHIPFETLPNQFVLKCNHNSGLGMVICTDKSKLNIKQVFNGLKKGLKQDYYLTGREWPYKNVKRKVICEQYLSDSFKSGLTDYKFFCFNGKVSFIGIFSGRNTNEETTADFFDRDFHRINMKRNYPNSKVEINQPICFDKMVAIAEKLSTGFPHLRVDLYLCGSQIYFGELTFFPGSGFTQFEPIDWDLEMGKYITLPKVIIVEGKITNFNNNEMM